MARVDHPLHRRCVEVSFSRLSLIASLLLLSTGAAEATAKQEDAVAAAAEAAVGEGAAPVVRAMHLHPHTGGPDRARRRRSAVSR